VVFSVWFFQCDDFLMLFFSLKNFFYKDEKYLMNVLMIFVKLVKQAIQNLWLKNSLNVLMVIF